MENSTLLGYKVSHVPLSVLKLRSLARNKFSKMSVKKMEEMLTPTSMFILIGTVTVYVRAHKINYS